MQHDQKKRNYRLFEQAFQQTSDGIIITDHQQPDEPITYVNPAFEALTGYSSNEILGRNCRFMQGEDHQEHARTQIRKVLRTGHSNVVLLRNYQKDGSPFWNELSLSPMRMADRQISHYIGVARDASHHVEHKLELEAAHQKLQKSLEDLNQLVITDPVTGIYNRRHYQAILEREWSICQRSKSHISLALIDIDNFKSYNDSFGHLAGDECLVQVANFLDEKFSRGGDLVARYGGEEFVVLCPGMEPEKVVEHVRRVCKELEGLNIRAGSNAARIHLTVSAGVACMIPSNNNSQAALLTLADERLYAAKQGGRNRVNAGDY